MLPELITYLIFIHEAMQMTLQSAVSNQFVLSINVQQENKYYNVLKMHPLSLSSGLLKPHRNCMFVTPEKSINN